MTYLQTTPKHVSATPSMARSGTLVVTLWIFGVVTSLFLLGMWGRTVAVDNATIEESARTVIDADIARDRINAWLEEGLATVAGLDSDGAHSVVEAVESSSEYHLAVNAIIGGFVDSLFAEEGETTSVDIEAALVPLVPVIVDQFDRRNVPVEENQIVDVLDDAGVVDLDAGEARSVASVVADAHVFLTQVVVVALVSMVVIGSLAVFLAQRRLSMVWHLATRVAVSAASYAVILRLAGWALDPRRGRSPVEGAASVLLTSNTVVLGLIGAVFGAFAALGYVVARRRDAVSMDVSTHSVDDDTKELALV